MDSQQVKMQEARFCSRLVENMAAIKQAGSVEQTEQVAKLRRLTDGRMLRNELESKYPLGRLLWLRITAKSGLFTRRPEAIVLKGQVLVRLERLVGDGSDGEPFTVEQLNCVLTEQADWAGRNACRMIVGLFSPTGWADSARAFISNEPPGSGWACSSVYPILIGPEITDLMWDRGNDDIKPYVPYFCGLTVTERDRVCRDYLHRRLVVNDFANLQDAADELGFGIEQTKAVAGEIAADSDKYALKKISGVGLVIKKKI